MGGRKLAQHTTLGLAGIGTFLASATTYAPTAHRCDKLARAHNTANMNHPREKKNLDFAARDNYDLLAVGCVCGLGGVTIPPHPRLNVDLEKLFIPPGAPAGGWRNIEFWGAGQPLPFKAKALWHANPKFFSGRVGRIYITHVGEKLCMSTRHDHLAPCTMRTC